jgi:pimeloyl-ACP methyl ester carboxylesterase
MLRSTGAAAALIAAAERPAQVCAVVSRGGRPDLAGDALARVTAPVMLIVGGLDHEVIDLNRHAASHLNVIHRTVVVPGASHLFEEPGKLEDVQRLALDWFDDWLVKGTESRRGQEWRPHA